MASCSVVPFWPNIKLDNMTLVDGGTRFLVDVASAVERCMEEVDDQSQITVDISLCFAMDLEKLNSSSRSASTNYLRYFYLAAWNRFMRDFTETQKAFPKVNYRYIFSPSVDLGMDLFNFSNELTRPMIQQGIKDAEAIVALGEGASV